MKYTKYFMKEYTQSFKLDNTEFTILPEKNDEHS
jgi:hypothetical protein